MRHTASVGTCNSQMAMVDCKEHGFTGVKMVCRHVAAAISDKKPLKTTKVELNDILLPRIRLCDECLSIWERTPEEGKEGFFDTLVPVCGKDFDEVIGASST
jgi:hypothetical protein